MGKIEIILGLSCLLFILICYFLLREISQMKKSAQSILQALEEGISGHFQPENFSENLEDAVTEKVNKFLFIHQKHQETAVGEKEKVKETITDMAHQIRTPLTNILLYGSLLQETKELETAHQMAKKIQQQGEKLDFYMEAMLRTSYLETEMIHVHLAENSLDKVIQEACQTVEVWALKKKIYIHFSESNVMGFFDKKWLREALVNVLENAIKYSPEKSTVKIKIEVYEIYLGVVVEDEGMGISEEEQGMIFQRFYRSPKVANEKGLGIGLYLVREIMEKQQGYVKLQSELGIGTKFSLYLPKATQKVTGLAGE